MELAHQTRHLGKAPGEVLRHYLGLQRAQAHAFHAGRIVHRADGVQQRILRAPAVAGQVDARDHDLPIARVRKALRLRTHLIQRHGAHRPPHAGDDAVGAVAVAALLNLHGGAGLALVPGNEQRLKLRALQRQHGVDAFVLRNGLLRQLHHAGALLYADYHPHAVHLENLLRVALGQTARHHDGAARMQPRDAPDQLLRLLVAGSGDGAGVDEVHVRLVLHRNGGIARALEGLQHGLGVVLVDLAAQRLHSDCSHPMSPQRSIAMVAAAMAAVSVRRMRGPSVICFAPSSSSARTSLSLMPPSGPMTIPIFLASG